MSGLLPEGWTDQTIAEAECFRWGHHWRLTPRYRICTHCGERERRHHAESAPSHFPSHIQPVQSKGDGADVSE